MQQFWGNTKYYSSAAYNWILRFVLLVAFVALMIVLGRTTLEEDHLFWWETAGCPTSDSGPCVSNEKTNPTPELNPPAPSGPPSNLTTPPNDPAHGGGTEENTTQPGRVHKTWAVIELLDRVFEALRVPSERGTTFVLVLLTAAPYLATFWSSFLLARRQKRVDATSLILPPSVANAVNLEWYPIGLRAQELWKSARSQRTLTYDRARDYAHIYGFVTTATLAACLIASIGVHIIPEKPVPYHATR
jgi:hypothetical protein